MIVDKKLAAKEQILTAIRLFFEDLSHISVHTLIGAALEICNNLVDDKHEVEKNNLMLHYDSIFVKNERRKEYIAATHKCRNFFKHAKNDRNESIEFNPEINELFLFEAIRVYCLVTGENSKQYIEMQMFIMWFTVKHKELFVEDYITTVYNLAKLINFDVECLNDKKLCLEVINKSRNRCMHM